MSAHLPPPRVRIVACGNADRGDDGAGVAALASLLPTLPRDLLAKLEVRRCEELRVDDLVDLPSDATCLIVDAVAGPDPGTVVRCALDDLTLDPACTPRSSHQLPIDIVLGLAGVLRQGSVPGVFVGIAGDGFGYGPALSRAVREGLPAFRDAIETEVRALAAAADAPTRDGSRARETTRSRRGGTTCV
jgi:hydrogenase maturation protease